MKDDIIKQIENEYMYEGLSIKMLSRKYGITAPRIRQLLDESEKILQYTELIYYLRVEFSVADLAKVLGISRYTVNSVLASLRKRNISNRFIRTSNERVKEMDLIIKKYYDKYNENVNSDNDDIYKSYIQDNLGQMALCKKYMISMNELQDRLNTCPRYVILAHILEKNLVNYKRLAITTGIDITIMRLIYGRHHRIDSRYSNQNYIDCYNYYKKRRCHADEIRDRADQYPTYVFRYIAHRCFQEEIIKRVNISAILKEIENGHTDYFKV